MLVFIPGVENPVDIDTDSATSWIKDIDWIKWGALAIVTLLIGIPLFGLLNWLKAGAKPIFWVAVVLLVLFLLGGGTLDFGK